LAAHVKTLATNSADGQAAHGFGANVVTECKLGELRGDGLSSFALMKLLRKSLRHS